jgi:Xaa-Pro aminopeptidase
MLGANMKNDLQNLMHKENIDVIWIMGPAFHNPAMVYFTGIRHVSQADLFIRQGLAPILFCDPMEREEAASTGIETIVTSKYDFMQVLKESNGKISLARAKVLKMMFDELGITQGRVSIYGKEEVGKVFGVLQELKKMLPDVELIGESNDSILLKARATKDEDEIERIRNMGKITTDVVGKTAALLQNSRVNQDEVLLNEEGKPLTIGQVKGLINLWLAKNGVENPEGTIFAIGRDAGIPHSAGKPDDPICLGKTIIFDIFPQEAGGGYFFDFTRTWCLGYAPPEEHKIYDDVKDVYDILMGELRLGVEAAFYQDRTCELFEERGHATIRQDNQLESGYVHSLGHGLGLDVHESPWFSRRGAEADLLTAGSVVTIEPGLYYPEEGMGCRLEDTVWVRPDGRMEILAEYPYDFVLPMKYWSDEN